MDFTFDPKKETIAQYTARTQAAIAANNPNDPNSARLTAPVAATPSVGAAPVGGNGQGTLTDFKSALDQAVSLAQQHRAQLLAPTMQQYQGTATASDFSSILGNLGRASDNFSERATKNALDAAQPQKLTEVSPGATLYDPSTGKSVYTAPTAKSQTSVTPTTPAGTPAPKPTFDSKSVTALKNALNASKFSGAEADGKYADPNLYLQNYNSWLAAGGTAEEFFKTFPPSTYINPTNTWLPPEILKFTKQTSGGITNPFK